jgi:SAM-dependent methyltransferase
LLAGINLPFYNFRFVNKLTGLDISDGMLKQARAKAKLMSSIPQVEFVQGNVERLPFKDNVFDTVVDTFSLCVYQDPIRALAEMARVAKPGVTLADALCSSKQDYSVFYVKSLHMLFMLGSAKFNCMCERENTCMCQCLNFLVWISMEPGFLVYRSLYTRTDLIVNVQMQLRQTTMLVHHHR